MARRTTATTKKITEFMGRNPDATPAHIAKMLKVPVVRVYSVRAKLKKEVVIEESTDAQSMERLNDLYFRVTEGRRKHLEAKPKSLWARVVGWFK